MRKYTPFNIYNILATSALWAIIILVLTQCACGMQAQTPSYIGVTPQVDAGQPVQVAAIVEPTEAAPQYMTTGALNVRAEPNADSEILGTLEPLTVVTVFILDVTGDDCYMGEWYQIDYKPEGGETVKAYVCSLWVVRK